MGTGENSKPTPLASQPLAKKMIQKKDEPARHRPRHRPETGGAQCHVAIESVENAIWEEKLQSGNPNFVSEIFKEEISYRAQARKFLWEFFD
jgi:hypothetical protein